jgi:hypothetical protein
MKQLIQLTLTVIATLLFSGAVVTVIMVTDTYRKDSRSGYFHSERMDETFTVVELGQCIGGRGSSNLCSSAVVSLAGERWTLQTHNPLMVGQQMYRYCWNQHSEKVCYSSFQQHPYAFVDNTYYRIGNWIKEGK